MRKNLGKFAAVVLTFGFTCCVSLIASADVHDKCQDALRNIPGSYTHYVEKSVERRGVSEAKHPEFLNPQKERQLAATQWKGEEAPAVLAPFLPEGVTFIGHQLKKASAPGVVKVEQPGADFMILRVEMPFKGRTIATNVTVNAQALHQNLARVRAGEKAWLIGPDATAALDWGHGGGTKTTGGHTADTLMNYMAKFNVFTVGMDQSFHGEGPREWFADDAEFFEFRVAFRNRFIHPDVPTFMVGHSYGGEIGDMAVRRSIDEGKYPGLKKAYAGIIPLSFVPDPAPGATTYKERTLAENLQEKEQKFIENAQRINEGDLDLFASLMAQDKCSALSGLQCSQIALYNIWKKESGLFLEKPLYMNQVGSYKDIKTAEGFKQLFKDYLLTNKGNLATGPIPSLYLMGEHDALNVQHEQDIETYVRPLQNSIYWTISSRVDFRGRLHRIGHMVFDHYTPKKVHPESMNAIREYLSKTDLFVPANEEQMLEVFKERVLKGSVKGLSPEIEKLSYLTPTNNYSSSLALMAYHRVPEFKSLIDGRIAMKAQAAGKSVTNYQSEYFLDYTEKSVFETYQVIRDFIGAVLEIQGKEMKEITPKQRIAEATAAGDPLANSRESILSVLKTYGNNLAYREFLQELVFTDINATDRFQTLNEIGQALNTRVKMLETIRKEKISDEQKAAKVEELGPILNDQGIMLEAGDKPAMQAALERLHTIRNKKYVPEDGNKEFAIANIQRRDDIQIESKALEQKREALKKELKELQDKLNKKEGALSHELTLFQSEKLKQLEKKRQELYDQLETYDWNQRTMLETHMAKILDEKIPWAQAFDQLPADIQQLFLDTEKASQTYQEILREIEQAKLSEALAGKLLESTHKLATEIYGAGGLAHQVNSLSRQIDVIEYIDIAALKEEGEKLLEDYINRVLPDYFVVAHVSLRDVINLPNVTDEGFKEQMKALEKSLSLWRSRVLVSKPAGEATGLY